VGLLRVALLAAIVVVGVLVLLLEVAALVALVALVELLLPVAAVLVLHPVVVAAERPNLQAVPAILTRTSRPIILAGEIRLAPILATVASRQAKVATSREMGQNSHRVQKE
jgi:hypothetical protein